MPIDSVDELVASLGEDGRDLAELKAWTEKALRSASRLTSYAVWSHIGPKKKASALLIGSPVTRFASDLRKAAAVEVGDGKLLYKDRVVRLTVDDSSKRQAVESALEKLFAALHLNVRVELASSTGKAPSGEDEEAWERRMERWEDVSKSIRDGAKRAPPSAKEAWAALKTTTDRMEQVIEARNALNAPKVDKKLDELEAEASRQEREDYDERRRLARFAARDVVPPPPDSDDAILVAKEDRIYVFLDSHQNKHQSPSSMIPQLGIWRSKKGSTFAAGKGLAWHQGHTAKAMLNWARSLDLQPGEEKVASKTAPIEGLIYDAHAHHDGYYVVVEYHCNPPESE